MPPILPYIVFATLTMFTLLFIHQKHILVSKYPALKRIDMEWKDKIEPSRVIINQFLRLFSGKILQSVVGAWSRTLRPPIILLGMLMNFSNSFINIWLSDSTGKSTKASTLDASQTSRMASSRTPPASPWLAMLKQRPLYSALTMMVLLLCIYSFSLTVTGAGGLIFFGVPSSILGAAIQFAAEIVEQFRRGREYYQARIIRIPVDLNAHIEQLIALKASLRRRQYANVITLITTSISWFSLFAPASVLLSMGNIGLQVLAVLGIGIAIANYLITKSSWYARFTLSSHGKPPRNTSNSYLRTEKVRLHIAHAKRLNQNTKDKIRMAKEANKKKAEANEKFAQAWRDLKITDLTMEEIDQLTEALVRVNQTTTTEYQRIIDLARQYGIPMDTSAQPSL